MLKLFDPEALNQTDLNCWPICKHYFEIPEVGKKLEVFLVLHLAH